MCRKKRNGWYTMGVLLVLMIMGLVTHSFADPELSVPKIPVGDVHPPMIR